MAVTSGAGRSGARVHLHLTRVTRFTPAISLGSIAVLAACALCACAAEVGTPGEPGDDEDVATSSAALTRVLRVDFESYARGPLPASWSLVTASDGSSSSASVESAGKHGHVLLLDADPRTTDYLTATLGFLWPERELEATVAIDPDPNAAFVWSLNGTSDEIAKRRIRLQRAPRSSMLVASTAPSGNTRCGRLPSRTWSTVTLRVHAKQTPHTFDVLINGARTACTGVASDVNAPFRGVAVMDASNSGWGGVVRFDDIVLRGSSPPPPDN
jgi:hypothetical protein